MRTELVYQGHRKFESGGAYVLYAYRSWQPWWNYDWAFTRRLEPVDQVEFWDSCGFAVPPDRAHELALLVLSHDQRAQLLRPA